jgi:hypothetical protein
MFLANRKVFLACGTLFAETHSELFLGAASVLISVLMTSKPSEKYANPATIVHVSQSG